MPTENKSYTRELPRILGLFDATSAVLSSIIGSGIFLVPAIIAQEVQSFAGIILVWVAAGVISLFGSMSYAELGAAFPRAGGQYVFLRDAYNPMTGFLFGWTFFVALAPGSFAALSVAFRDTLATIITITPFWGKIVPILVIVGIVAANYRATRLGANIQNTLTVMKIGALLIVIGVVAFGNAGSAKNFLPLMPKDMTTNEFFHSVTIAMIPAFWAYNGWNRVCYSAGEIKNAARVIPMSLYFGMAVVIFLYLSSNLSYVSAFSVEGIARSSNVAADTVRFSLGDPGRLFISIAILISISGTMATAALADPRVLFAMSRDGLFFSACGWVHPRFETPAFAIVIPAVLGIILSLIGNFRELLTLNILFNWIFYGITVIGIFLLRKKFPGMERPYKTWGYPIIPLLFTAAVAWVVVSELSHVGDRTPMTMLGLGLVLLGFPAYFFWKKSPSQKVKDEMKV